MSEESTVEALLSGVRFGQFVSVGVVGATAETVIVFLLTALLGIWAIPAKAIGAEVSITLMFLVNDRWTFAGEGEGSRRSVLGRYLRSHLVRLGGISVAFVVLYLLVEFTAISLVAFGADLWPTVANGIGIGVGMMLNYLFESLFTWRVHR
jgi:putative flippase GtrA